MDKIYVVTKHTSTAEIGHGVYFKKEMLFALREKPIEIESYARALLITFIDDLNNLAAREKRIVENCEVRDGRRSYGPERYYLTCELSGSPIWMHNSCTIDIYIDVEELEIRE